MTVISIVLLVLLFISGTGLVIFILMHSGKGTGISDAIASSMYSTQTGTSIIEKNLDRITIVCAVIFMVTLILMMIFFPVGMIQSSS
jgi:preprotein translocase subunit SecG